MNGAFNVKNITFETDGGEYVGRSGGHEIVVEHIPFFSKYCVSYRKDDERKYLFENNKNGYTTTRKRGYVAHFDSLAAACFVGVNHDRYVKM